ncbi:Spx/MgsR family RNA polymerase-binding regulatory protein [Pollutimonas thiosulfatoxidans]|uniref:Arsenate reductase n=1 Tax=Pollutimonas thiosulfatoxidans TaxID=2028345 RepID=A0A410GBT2_9BURK|nr:Spx/MgsR family RNA polymerase-binding regulatory protein [Pollutimonas thiosulfatoxidans]QAA93744.1 arsenate reductase [Pollutimonas thiosulfatoxidans]
MRSIAVYGLKKCSTCIKAMAWLEANGMPFAFTDYRDNPIAPAVLAVLADELGGWEKLVNRASMTWRNLPAERKAPQTAQDWLALIAEFPALIRRPVMVDADGQVSVGFSEKKYSAIFA